jgi:hypothetical protein
VFNRLREKNAKNLRSEMENIENLVKSTKEFKGATPPKFGEYFVKNKSASLKIILALIMYLIASTCQFGSVFFLHYIGWHNIHDDVFSIKQKLVKCVIFLLAIIISYSMYICSGLTINLSLGNNMYQFFSDLLIKRLLNADVYKILHNTVYSLYKTNISANLDNFTTNIPKMMDCLGYNLSLSLAYFSILVIFVSPIFIILAILYFILISINWRSNYNDLSQIKDIDSFLKIKFNSVLDDLIIGINHIRAA